MKSWYLSPAERQALEAQLRHTHEAKLFRRLLALLEVARGRSVSSVARELRVDRRSVYYWLDRYERERTGEALRHQPGQGRPPDWSEEVATWVEAIMDEPPLHFGYVANYWTVPLLEEFLAGLFPESSLSGSTVRRGLKALGYVWKRFRYELLPDPQEAKKNANYCGKLRLCSPVRRFWLRMKPICSCFRPYGQVGRGKANRRWFRSLATMRVARCSAPCTCAPAIGWP